MGATPHLGMPRSASGRMAMCIPILPSAAGSLPSISPWQEGCLGRLGRARPESGGMGCVSSERGRRLARRCPTARRRGGRRPAAKPGRRALRSSGRGSRCRIAVGGRGRDASPKLARGRRAMAAVGGGFVDPPCSPRRLVAFPHGKIGLGATPGGRRRVLRKHTRPRTRTRPSDWWVAPVPASAARAALAGLAAHAHDVTVQRLALPRRCASPERQSAHRPPTSFARSSTALSRSAGCRPTQLRRAAPSCRADDMVRPQLARLLDPPPRRNASSWRLGQRRPARSPNDRSVNRSDDPR